MATDPIRQFRSDDAAECSRIVRVCVEVDPWLPPELREELLRSESPESMCERADRFYMAVYLVKDTVTALGGIELNEIRLLYVAPEHQRKGIGGTLLRHLETWVPSTLFSDISVYASPGAVRFYQSNGYKPGGEHVFAAGSWSVPTIFMTKKLAI